MARSENAPIRIKIGDFFHEQLRLDQYELISSEIFDARLPTPLTQRLYVFLEAMGGWKVDGERYYYRATVDDELLTTLQFTDSNATRRIAKLRAACDAIRAADTHYVLCELRPPNQAASGSFGGL